MLWAHNLHVATQPGPGRLGMLPVCQVTEVSCDDVGHLPPRRTGIQRHVLTKHERLLRLEETATKRKLKLWIAAGEDRGTPPELTLERLDRLRNDGHPIQVAVFPGTDHGIVEFEEAPDGSRVYGGNAPGYFALLADWARGRVSARYGSAELIGLFDRRADCS